MLCGKFQDYRICRRFLKSFTVYGHGSHLGHVAWAIYIKFLSSFPKRNLALIGQMVTEKKIFKNNGRIHVYYET